MREAILAVSFGTTVDQARSRDLEGVEQALSAAAPVTVPLRIFRPYSTRLAQKPVASLPPELIPMTSLLVYALVASFRTWYWLALL